MAKFLHGTELTVAINNILGEPDNSSAVAFWGNGSEHRLPAAGQGDFRVICNLTAGGTNPYAIENMKRENLRHSPHLHAKVYLGASIAIIASANVSTNGLGNENVEGKWIEAGVEVAKNAEHDLWFKKLWESADKITDEDIEQAKYVWNHRPIAPVFSFEQFNVHSDILPTLNWIVPANTEPNIESVRKQRVSPSADSDAELERLINESIEVESEADAKYLSAQPWALVWFMTSSERPSRHRKPYWFKPGRYHTKTFRVVGESRYRNSVFPSEEKAAPPFALDAEFYAAFYTVMDKPEYKPLNQQLNAAPWYKPDRLRLIRQFWIDCQTEYLMGRK